MTTGQRWRTFLFKPFVFFTILMVLKIYLAHFVIFENESALVPLATGLPSVWLVFCLVELLFPRWKLGAYTIANLLMTSIYFAVIMYYKYFGVIVTYHALQQVNQVTEVKGSVFSLMHPYFLLIYVDIVLIFIALLASKKLRRWRREAAVREGTRTFAAIGVLALVACFCIVWPQRHSMNELVQAQGMGILNYEVYVGFAASKDEPVDVGSITPEAVSQLKGAERPDSPAYWGAAEGKNVIVIQLEAFQNFLIGLQVDGKEITPNLNKLAGESLYFNHFFQQAGQGNTSDAEFVVNTSFLIPQHGAASQVYADRELPSMPRTFGEHGYDTATFHTNNVEFWNRKELYKALDWNRYYDNEFFGDEDTVMFAASDEVLYSKTADELANMQAAGKPFYVQVISMSAHHPFNLPKRKSKMELPERYKDTLVGDYIEAQNYADWALGQFIEQLKSNGVWDNSLVVIYGDHQGLPIYSLTADEKDLMKEIYGREYKVQDMMNIPLILKLPAPAPGEPAVEPKTFEQLGGQSDLFPTIANLTGISLDDHVLFGQDILNTENNVLPERYYLPSGSFLNEDGVFIPGKGYEDGQFETFAGERDEEEQDEGESGATEEQYDQALELLSMSDTYVRSLPKHE
ncbi:LTA synthase family protein [Cohnella fermenti]|uniref:LTA synthase family protein n=1 Tax=Cohnella fermenti TaxID=2565925 RepID=A0A4S4BSM2_9BACL|nr:LTA synthase family protein [Cohnella fermenti]THF78046.1 LTA synthase family protein [Cohnella fermenti]